MFNLEEYYEKAWTGHVCGDTSVVDYIKSFDKVVLWGASFQGKAIGKKLLELGVEIECYWDLRYDEIKSMNGVRVYPLFSSIEKKMKEKTVVIICIGNRVIFNSLIMQLSNNGFNNHIFGDYLYMGLLCPFSVDTGIKAKRCTATMECRQIYCRRIQGILKSRFEDKGLAFPSVTFVINQVCSLKCKYCTSYMNEYPLNERKNFSLEQIESDIDKFMQCIDYVGTITVMGGEPFLHPQLSKIVQCLCKYDNFGLISIATSGTVPFKESQLEGLCDDRVNISFSNYTATISEKQKEYFYSNIELVRNKGLNYTVGLVSPQWIVPVTLREKGVSDEQAREKKSKCTHWDQIKNGKIHPCDYGNAIYSLGINTDGLGYVDLNEEISVDELRKKIIDYRNRDFYPCCRYDHYEENDGKITGQAAEQGYECFV